MFSHILVPLENSYADETILAMVRRIARCCGARLTLIHVADGFVARNQPMLADSPEMIDDRAYLNRRCVELGAEGFVVEGVLVCGEPAEKILAHSQTSGCDLIAMATHGHRGVSDLILGSVASIVRHRTELPVLLVKAPVR